MLLEFSVSNYKSFREKVVLDFRAANYDDLPENLVITDSCNILKSVVVYGANAGGKSNLIKALLTMKDMVINSSKETQINEKMDYNPFLLQEGWREKGTEFAVIFLIEGKEYNYGFVYTGDEILREWLTIKDGERKRQLFSRENQQIKIFRNYTEGRGFQDRVRKNSLFLSLMGQLNGAYASVVLGWFQKINFVLYHELDQINHISNTPIPSAKDKYLKEALLRQIDVNINSIEEKTPGNDSTIEKLQYMLSASSSRFWTIHNLYDRAGKISGEVKLNMHRDESDGTQKYFNLLEPVIESLRNGTILVIDEFEAKLHPLLVNSLMMLMNSKIANKNGAQLITTTHQTQMLRQDLLRRDQIYFVEKNQQEASELYSLSKFKPRNDMSIEKHYLAGRFGAVPAIGNLEVLFNQK
jgi:AAA15 family ATPase/GTPase